MFFFSFRNIFLIFLFLSVLSNAQYMKTQNCNPTTCKLPNCYCPSFNIPGNLPLSKTPQFIYMTLDDSMFEEDFIRMNRYNWILNNPLIKDSLGCTVKLSWYAMEECKIIQNI